ncbi:MAG TPA: hypothetical protein VHB27_08645 [Rhodopila sp.]|uniref:hypothetical protein n=1 Tax=Rhodopila sp. TaxID=2480087 RepID=UPI002CC04B81|nr:hypothetical protein [Rhodopila sp.]HVY15282.1 hypothetical protein [Rhodopila sp.]
MPIAAVQTPFVPVQVTGSYEDWGSLVLSWAAGAATPPGAAYSDDSTWRYVFPAQADGHKQIGTDGAGVIFPDTVQEVVFVRDTSTRRYVRLPDPEMAKAAQDEMAAGSNYSLPRFYSDAPLNCEMPENLAQKLKLQKERVGDYSIGSCM